MGFTSANNSNVNHSNGNYEVDGIIFASRFVYKTIKRIDRNLRYLYTPGSEETDWLAINDSPVRDDEEEFNAILDIVDELIDRIFNIDNGSTDYFLCKEKSGDFFEKFGGIMDCINELVHSSPQNNFEYRIRDIGRGLTKIGHQTFSGGIPPFSHLSALAPS